MAKLIDGKALAAGIRAELAQRILARAEQGKRRPGLVTILVGDDPASKVYVARKRKRV